MKKTVYKMIEFSVQHPCTVIALAFIITLFFVFQIKTLETKTDVGELFPEGMAEDRLDNPAVLVRGDTLFTAEGLVLFQQSIRELETEFSAVWVPDPFSHIILSRSRRPLVPVSFTPGGIAPLSNEVLDDVSSLPPLLMLGEDYKLKTRGVPT